MRKNKYFFFSLWILINSVISFITAWIVSEVYDYSYATILPISLIKVNCISGFATAAGYYFGKKICNKNYIVVYTKVIFFSLAGAFAGYLFSSLIVHLLFPEQERRFDRFTWGSLAILTIIISILASSIDMLLRKNQDFKNKVDLLSAKNPATLVIKEKGSLLKIKYSELIYISSASKKSILHSVKEDLEISMLMKDLTILIQNKKFIRIHKQYIVNIDFITRFYHVRSGLYEVLLNDDDDTILPVGRMYSGNLKNQLSFHSAREVL